MTALLRTTLFWLGLPLVATISGAWADEPPAAFAIRVPDGFAVELAAGPPLVRHPMLGGFDDRGRLFLAESAGLNLRAAELEEQLPNFIRMLEDTNGDGRFDRGTIFADKMTLPMGALWYDGALYVASPPSIWRLEDTTGDGVADKRDEIVSKFGYNGNAADIHGCFLGPEGRVYWCDGRHGHELRTPDGQVYSQGQAARIFSCRLDGSDVRVHCGGGMDNPVEIDFTDEGEMFGTVNLLYRERGDCIVHWLHGGVYPRRDQQKCLDEFARTGDLLGPVLDVGHVAVSGMLRYRSGVFGSEFRDNLFYTEFNTHKVLRVVLERSGSTFRGRVEEFFAADSPDFHPTDVVEDADGSLLVIDTGGWFRIGCPASQVAKPEIAGGIYRVRKANAHRLDDPRGRQISWSQLSPSELVSLLDDERFAVRERAMEELARREAAAARPLATALQSESYRARQNAVWSLCRIGTEPARAALRTALGDRDRRVVQAAAYAVGTLRDPLAAQPLRAILEAEAHEVRRQAATALGQIGQPDAVPDLLAALETPVDRELEHALVYALIEIADGQATRAGLAAPSPQVRRAALIALDQMPGGNLARDEVAPLLASGDLALQQAALEVIVRRPGWADQIVGLASAWLREGELPDERAAMLRGIVSGFEHDLQVQQLVADVLGDQRTSRAVRLLLLETIGRSELAELPIVWLERLDDALHAAQPDVLQQAVSAGASLPTNRFDEHLRRLAADEKQPLELRMAALSGVTRRGGALDDGELVFLLAQLDEGVAPVQRLAAATALGRATLAKPQLLRLADPLRAAGPLELPALAAAFERSGDRDVGLRLVAALREAPGGPGLPPARLQHLLAGYPDEVRAAAEALFQRASREDAEAAERLERLQAVLEGGHAGRGKQVFFNSRTACSACHRAGGEGGNIGPDLSAIGRIRTPRDLLEAIVLPSASLARGFESYTLSTDDGRVFTGVVSLETADAIHLRTAQREEVRILRSHIDQIVASPISIMPQGLEKTMTEAELADLVAFLASLGR